MIRVCQQRWVSRNVWQLQGAQWWGSSGFVDWSLKTLSTFSSKPTQPWLWTASHDITLVSAEKKQPPKSMIHQKVTRDTTTVAFRREKYTTLLYAATLSHRSTVQQKYAGQPPSRCCFVASSNYCIWGFPKIGPPPAPLDHPFYGISPYKPSVWRYPHLWKPLYS